MKILFQNFKKNKVKLKIESLDDLWSLSYIIEKGDIIKATTLRKIKLGKDTERDSKIIKKPVFLSIRTEKIEFHKYSNVLRVNGLITDGPEDIARGSFHTINLEENSVFELTKEQFHNYQIEKLKEATQEIPSKVLICVHDREEAIFALLKKYGYSVLSSVKGTVSKKSEDNIKTEDFYASIIKMIKDYDKRYGVDNIIVASPSFWKEYLMKKISDDSLKKKIVLASCSTTGETGINEVIKRQEVQEVLKRQKFSKEIKLVEKLLEEISKDNLASYGIEHVREAVSAGAVSELLITDEFIHKKRQEDDFEDIDSLMKQAEKANGSVHIITSEHEGGNKLDGLGGIAALLRYKLNY
ncbi:mRNA surveillance protein pelota [Candidatus Woesearchaeota archaeon]|nr:mRNA surveillance protein pelota [Candidatus Woesearchaeota archaeon]